MNKTKGTKEKLIKLGLDTPIGLLEGKDKYGKHPYFIREDKKGNLILFKGHKEIFPIENKEDMKKAIELRDETLKKIEELEYYFVKEISKKYEDIFWIKEDGYVNFNSLIFRISVTTRYAKDGDGNYTDKYKLKVRKVEYPNNNINLSSRKDKSYLFSEDGKEKVAENVIKKDFLSVALKLLFSKGNTLSDELKYIQCLTGKKIKAEKILTYMFDMKEFSDYIKEEYKNIKVTNEKFKIDEEKDFKEMEELIESLNKSRPEGRKEITSISNKTKIYADKCFFYLIKSGTVKIIKRKK